MPARETRRRYLMFIAGVLISALGIGFISRAALGTSPISSLPFVLSLSTPLSMGVYTMAFNLLFLAGEVVLRRRFTAVQALQIPATLLFSACIDGALWLIPTQLHGPYPLKVACLLAGCALLALGVTLEVFADVIMLPGEALVRAISEKTGWQFHRVKMFFDGGLTVIAVLLALCVFGRLNGVREGTVAAAFLVGRLVGVYSRRLSFLRDRLLAPASAAPGGIP